MAKHLIANLSDIDPKGSRTVRLGDTEIALFRLTGDEVLAVENHCPHKGGKLSEGMVCGSTVHCPLHDWKIDLKSGKVQEPDDGCVTTYELEIDRVSGSIYLTV
ncbi:nitrite reductase small subunit NirD [Cohnella sp. CFH 77786]|uniref:nitrite reductase small subunit NirD n=1 Tax=Cohnella sp. CFH 77786 TaxID=2662265 RepID=UPI001C60C593|nr:nitrite reductase small subunit NirD [Cohnella sp. CFH 77786]MBW5446343.1 nitrite reductase small subunit NirD [Cohnella sp. CFH 77786]